MTRELVSLLIIAACATIFAISCSDSSTDFRTGEFAGITQTDLTGAILSNDPDDWGCMDTVFNQVTDTTPRSVVPSHLCFEPAYPNPTVDGINIRFLLPVTLQIRLWVTDGRGFTLQLSNNTFEPGSYDYYWDCTSVPPGIYRAYLETALWSCHGDILVQ